MKRTVSLGEKILNFLEKKSSTNLRKLSQEWSWLVFGRFVAAISSLLLASAYAHYLTQEQYGTYKYILAIFSIVAVFTLLGMEDASQRAIARGNEGSFWTTLKVRFKFGILTALSSAAVGLYYLLQGNFVLGTIFLASAPFLVLLNTVRHYNTILTGRQFFREISINNVLVQIASAITIIVVVTLTSNLYWLIAAFLLSGIVFSSLAFAYTIRKHPLNDKEDPVAMEYGKHMSLFGIVNIATTQAAPFLLWHFMSPIELAIYSFALAAVTQLQGLFKLLTTTMAFPKLSKLDVQVLKTTLPHKVLIAHAITIPTAIISALLLPYLYQLLFPTYMESVIYAQAMTLLLAFMPLRLYSTALMAHGSPKSIHSYSVISSALLLSGMVVLIPLFGIWGVILANVTSQIVTNFVVLYFFKKM